MKIGAVLLAGLVMAGLTVPAAAAELRDVERGRALYENHCQVCHTPRVHGRVNRLPITIAELRGIVESWQRDQKLRWSAQEIDDVTEYLNQTRYRYTR
jgi:mono/diheme cytochrome c family protein